MEDAVILGVVANIIGSAIGQKEIQDALNERNMKLEKAYNELKKIEIMKDEFISNLSHELRTPLNSVMGYSELLMEDESAPPDSKQKRVASSVYYSSKRLSSLIDSLLYILYSRSFITSLAGSLPCHNTALFVSPASPLPEAICLAVQNIQ